MREKDSRHSDALARYCRGFGRAQATWPALPLQDEPELGWWRTFNARVIATRTRGEAFLHALGRALPQLRLPQVAGISHSEFYTATVLRDEDPGKLPMATIGEAPRWHEPDKIRFWIATHPCGALPVIQASNRDDFVQLVRALAYRGEPIRLSEGLHAQAVSGLIHWGIIKEYGQQCRARLVILHESPYGSVPAKDVPGKPSESEWLRASTSLRLEHELTHLAMKRLLEEMRLNLLDELIADCMGMLAALGLFDATLFRRCLGVDEVNGRWTTYTTELSGAQQGQVLRMVMSRACELEQWLSDEPWLRAPGQAMTRLRWLCQQRLDQPISKPPHGQVCHSSIYR